MAQKKNIKSIISNPLIQTFLIYVSGGWIVLEMTDYFINNYGLSETFRDILLIIMLAGLPVALILSWYLSRDKSEDDDDLPVEPGKQSSWFFKGYAQKALVFYSGNSNVYSDRNFSHKIDLPAWF